MEFSNSFSDDYNCPICLNLLYQPVKLPCEHLFCLSCISVFKENLLENAKCPLCRSDFSKSLIENTKISQILKEKFPDIYAQRAFEFEKILKEESLYNRIRFFYGNLHSLLKNENSKNNHEWTFFFKSQNPKDNIKDYVWKIDVELDPSFGGVPFTLRSQPFEITRKGYGEFTINFTVFWQKWLKLEPNKFDYNISFQNKEKKNAYILKFPKILIKK